MTSWVDLHAELPGLRGGRIHVTPASLEARVREVLVRYGFDVRTLEGSRIADEGSFFEEAARALPLPEYFGHDWDALDDGLGDLQEGSHRRVAFLWRDVDRSLEADAQVVVNGILAFEWAAAHPDADRVGDAEPLQLEVFLFGRTPGFLRRE